MKKVLLVLAMGAFLYSCGGPSTCDCVNASKEEMKDEDFKKACDELEDEWQEEYKEASKDEKKEMMDELKACKDDK